MKIEIRFIGESEKGRDKRIMDFTRECTDLAQAERFARAVIAKSNPEEQASVKRLAFVIDVAAATVFATPVVPTDLSATRHG